MPRRERRLARSRKIRVMTQPTWLIYAILAALAAAMVGVFGKLGMKEVDSTLATTVRSIVMSVFLVGVATYLGLWGKIGSISSNHKGLWMIVLSGIAGAVSWLFYFKAIQAGTVSQVAPVDKLSMPMAIFLAMFVLGERPTVINWAGIVLIVIGAYLASITR